MWQNFGSGGPAGVDTLEAASMSEPVPASSKSPLTKEHDEEDVAETICH